VNDQSVYVYSGLVFRDAYVDRAAVGTTFAHALEAPVKMNVDAQAWRTFQQTLYPYFANMLSLSHVARHGPG
jgi:hypothetical protein